MASPKIKCIFSRLKQHSLLTTPLLISIIEFLKESEKMNKTPDTVVFRMENITKRFGGLKALSEVHLSV